MEESHSCFDRHEFVGFRRRDPLQLLLGRTSRGLVVAEFLGRLIMKPEAGHRGKFALSLLVGLAILLVVHQLPFVGGTIHFLVWLLGFGIAARRLREVIVRTTGGASGGAPAQAAATATA